MLRFLWFGLVPAVLSAGTYALLVPSYPGAQSSAPVRVLTWMGRENGIALLVLLFLLFSGLVRYWRAYLPGGRQLDAPAPARSSSGRRTLSVVAALLLAAGAGWLFRARVGESYRVMSTSMVPTLLPADRLWADKSAFAAAPPRRGDVVVFRTPPGESGPPSVVKRVIGLPGDRVSLGNGRPIINGWTVPGCEVAPLVHYNAGQAMVGRLVVEFLEGTAYLVLRETLVPGFPEYEVRPGEVFVLGDNRGGSKDSRGWGAGKPGGVALAAIHGRVQRVVVASRLDGGIDWRRSGKALGFDLSWLPPRLDTHALEAGIDRCLQKPPTSTAPPPRPQGTAALSVP